MKLEDNANKKANVSFITPKEPAKHSANSGPALLKQLVNSDIQQEHASTLNVMDPATEQKTVDSDTPSNLPDPSNQLEPLF